MGVKKSMQILKIALLLIISISLLSGCQRKIDVPKPSDTLIPTSTDDKPTNKEEEVETVDITALEEGFTGVPLTLISGRHYVFLGTFGEEDVFVDLWIDKELNEAQISVLGGFHADLLKYDARLLEDGLRVRTDNEFMIIREQEENTFKGYFYEKGSDVVEVSLRFLYYNTSEDKDCLYTLGSNERVEEFAQEVIDTVNTEDIEQFAKDIQFPVNLYLDGIVTTIQTKEEFLAIPKEKVFTVGFCANMMESYPNFLYENEYKGIMIGNETYHVWFKTDDSGNFKIVDIHN